MSFQPKHVRSKMHGETENGDEMESEEGTEETIQQGTEHIIPKKRRRDTVQSI